VGAVVPAAPGAVGEAGDVGTGVADELVAPPPGGLVAVAEGAQELTEPRLVLVERQGRGQPDDRGELRAAGGIGGQQRRRPLGGAGGPALLLRRQPRRSRLDEGEGGEEHGEADRAQLHSRASATTARRGAAAGEATRPSPGSQ
jgi:hypothetical protein